MLCCLVLCLFVWSKVSSYKKEFFITSPTLFREYPHSAEIAELISRLACGADSIVVAPYYPDVITTAIGVFSPDNVRFLTTLSISDEHLFKNSSCVSELPSRTNINKIVNVYNQGIDGEPLIPYLNKIDFLIISAIQGPYIEEFLSRNSIKYSKYSIHTYNIYHLKSIERQ